MYDQNITIWFDYKTNKIYFLYLIDNCRRGLINGGLVVLSVVFAALPDVLAAMVEVFAGLSEALAVLPDILAAIPKALAVVA